MRYAAAVCGVLKGDEEEERSVRRVEVTLNEEAECGNKRKRKKRIHGDIFIVFFSPTIAAFSS